MLLHCAPFYSGQGLEEYSSPWERGLRMPSWEWGGSDCSGMLCSQWAWFQAGHALGLPSPLWSLLWWVGKQKPLGTSP